MKKVELAESHESHARQVKKLEEELDYYKQLDCEESDGGSKATYIEKSFEDIAIDKMKLKLIEWIQATQSEMDLQIKTPKEILEEYYD